MPGYDIFDRKMMLMDLDRLSASISSLAEFHGLCTAFDLCSDNTIVEQFPVFEPQNLMWVQTDMLHFLESVSQNAEKFLFR